MGSFQQISLGVVCLVAAFAFGAYVNNNRLGDSTQVSDLDNLLNPNQIGNVQSRISLDDLAAVDKRPAPIATMRNPLPPPSQLSIPRAKAKPGTSLGMPIQSPAKSAIPAGLQVPDFSTIAAEFKNTPIELPPMGVLPNRRMKNADELERAPSETLKDRLVQNRQFSPSELPPRINSQSKSNSPAPSQAWNLESEPTKLSNEDFAPKLKDQIPDAPLNALTPVQPPKSQLAFGGPPIAPIDRSPKINRSGGTSGTDSANPAAAAMPLSDPVPPAATFADQSRPRGTERSNLSDPPVSILSQPSQPISQTLDTSSTYQLADRRIDGTFTNNVSSPDIQVAKRVPAQLPFGLTNQSKNDLARLRSNADSKLRSANTQFVDHVVEPGETLQSISTRYFGKPDMYLDIYLANRSKLRNPAVVPAGITVRIPMYQ